jgi:8-oxo-dGTP diphosphatase
VSTKTSTYHQLSVTTDIVVFCVSEKDLQVLLVKRSNQPFLGEWALPGGFLLKNETSKSAGQRILKDKAGATHVYIEQLYTFDDFKRDPRGQIVSIVYVALTSKDKLNINSQTASETPTFFPINKLPKLAFDHHQILNYSIKRIRAKLEYTNIVYALLPKRFSMTELQRTYEIILGRKLDKRNFQKKYLSLGLIQRTTAKRQGTAHRPASLYEFSVHAPQELKKFI